MRSFEKNLYIFDDKLNSCVVLKNETINERTNERTFERSTILRNNSHQTKSKSCVEWTMKVSVLVCFAVFLSLCICLSYTHIVTVFMLPICFIVLVCIGACIVLCVAFVLCAVFRGQFDVLFNKRSKKIVSSFPFVIVALWIGSSYLAVYKLSTERSECSVRIFNRFLCTQRWTYRITVCATALRLRRQQHRLVEFRIFEHDAYNIEHIVKSGEGFDLMGGADGKINTSI